MSKYLKLAFSMLTRPLLMLLMYFCSSSNLNATPADWGQIDSIVNDAMARKAFPGCQVLVIKDGIAIYDKCFGQLTYESEQAVSPFTMYDLASVTKTSATLLAIMKLYDDGKLKLTDKASEYLQFLKNTDKENITLAELLYHESGLPAYISFGKNPGYLEQALINKMAMHAIAKVPLKAKTYVYSCVNFILLKEIIEAITHLSMDEFLRKTFYEPMDLKNTTFLPLKSHLINQIAPTLRKETFQNGLLQGIVHDPDAAYLGGVSGNAGLFSTAHEVAALHQMLLNNGVFNSNRYLCIETCQLFTTSTSISGRRGLGYDKPTPTKPASSPCSALAPTSVVGHTGYTGTCCWVDPENQLIYVFLSNRTYPNDAENKLAKLSIRPKIQTIIYKMILQ